MDQFSDKCSLQQPGTFAVSWSDNALEISADDFIGIGERRVQQCSGRFREVRFGLLERGWVVFPQVFAQSAQISSIEFRRIDSGECFMNARWQSMRQLLRVRHTFEARPGTRLEEDHLTSSAIAKHRSQILSRSHFGLQAEGRFQRPLTKPAVAKICGKEMTAKTKRRSEISFRMV